MTMAAAGSALVTPNRPLEPGTKAVMLGGGLTVALALGAINSVLPQIEADLARSPNDSLLIKQLVGIVGLAMVVGAPCAGFLVDRIGARRVVIAACSLYAAIGTTGLYLTNLPALIVSRMLLGIAAVTITTTAMTLINTCLSGIERAKWMGAHVGIAMVGSIVINPIAGLLGEFGWRWPFALYAIGLALALLALGLERQIVQHASAAGVTKRESPLLTWFPLRYAVLAVLIGSITYLPMVYLPFLMREMGITSSTIISLVLTGDVALGAIVALLYGRFRRHLSIYSTFACSFACAGTGMFVAATASTLLGVVAGMMIFGIGLGWFVPNLMTAVSQQVQPEQQGRATGLVKGAHHLAAPLCIVMVEPLARRFGPEGAMLTAAGVACVLLLFMGFRALTTRQRQRAGARAAPG